MLLSIYITLLTVTYYIQIIFKKSAVDSVYGLDYNIFIIFMIISVQRNRFVLFYV